MRGFVTGLGGGLVSVALVVGTLVLTGVLPTTGTTTRTVVQSAQSTSPVSYSTGDLTPNEVYDKCVGGVVEINATFSGTMDYFGQSSGSGQAVGSGFVLSTDGYIVTNSHVVSENGTLASSVTVVFNKDGANAQEVNGTIVGTDDSTDVALIKVDPDAVSGLTALEVGDSSALEVGEQVVAIGSPLDLEFSLTVGVVSAVGREIESPSGETITDAIQTDASINPGNSGGPLIDSSGKVIGINEQIATQSGGNEGIGFAVPINTVLKVVEQLQSGQSDGGTTQDSQDQSQDQTPYGQDQTPYGQDGQLRDPSQIW